MTLWDYEAGDARDLSSEKRAMSEHIDDLEDEARKLKANQDYYRQCHRPSAKARLSSLSNRKVISFILIGANGL